MPLDIGATAEFMDLTALRIPTLNTTTKSTGESKEGQGEAGLGLSPTGCPFPTRRRRQTMTEIEVIYIDRHGQRKEYPSIKSAAEDVGVRPCRISTACVTAHRCAGRYWIKKEDMDG